MPESTNVTLLELSARYLVGGNEQVLQRYPTDRDFLVVPPADDKSPPLQWTSSNSQILGNTTLCEIPKTVLAHYASPRSIITPISKRSRNNFEAVCLGRSDEADIRFTCPTVSKIHAKFFKKGNRLLLSDQQSTNGTFIKDYRLLPDSVGEIAPTQELKFGIVKCVYLDLEQLLDLVKLAAKR